MSKRRTSGRHPEDEDGVTIPRPTIDGEAYTVIGREWWWSHGVVVEVLQQDWDDYAGHTTEGTSRHAGVVRRQAHVKDLIPSEEVEEEDPRRKSRTDRPGVRLGNPVGMEENQPVGPGEAMLDALAAAMSTLTDCQLEVLDHVSAGVSDREIAVLLDVSHQNVRQHRLLGLRKLRRALDTWQP